MAGVAATQRPDLWRALVALVPITDLIGLIRDPYGRAQLQSEYANPDDPNEVRRLSTFSPYHLVSDDLAYPAMFIQAGATDPRCPPWHARKLAARLQSAQRNEAPAFLSISNKAGHGPATAKTIQIENTVEWLAFVMQQLNMSPAQ
jgi:prolyl oligopeptidase